MSKNTGVVFQAIAKAEPVEAVAENEPELDAWAEPIPLDTLSAPSIPAGFLPGWAGAFVDAVADETETPRELAAMITLATLATCAAKAYVIKPHAGSYFEPLNLWTVAALEPGNRKSAVLAACTHPLMVWESRRAAAMKVEIEDVTSMRAIAEGRIKSLEGQAHKAKAEDLEVLVGQIKAVRADLPEIPVPPRMWTGDVTPERLGSLMAEHGERMAILSAEGGIFDIIGGRYSNGIPNLDLFLQAHSGDSVRVDRGSREPVYMRNPALTLGLSPQPDVLKGLTDTPGFRGRGLLGRFLYTMPPSRVGYRTLEARPIPEDVAADYFAGITAMLNMSPARDHDGNAAPRELMLSDEAFQDWHSFRVHVEAMMRPGCELEFIKDWGGKLPGAALRIAGLFHVATFAHSDPEAFRVNGETMDLALQLSAVLISHALAVFNLMGADPSLDAARHLWSWIQRHKQATFIARDAFNALKGRYKRMEELEPAFAVLTERQHIREVPRSGGRRGRPSRAFDVNPAMVGAWS